MLIVRIFSLLVLLCIGGGVLAWLITGQQRYRRFAQQSAYLFIGLIVLLVVLLVFERFIGSFNG